MSKKFTERADQSDWEGPWMNNTFSEKQIDKFRALRSSSKNDDDLTAVILSIITFVLGLGLGLYLAKAIA